MSQFAVGQLTTGGRKFVAEIVDVSETTKDWPARDGRPAETVTQLQLNFKRPDGVVEYEWYKIPADAKKGISARSDLGKLIQYFSKMGISDIGIDGYKPITNLFVEVECFSRENRTTGESRDKKFPIRLLTADDIASEFGGASVPKTAINKDELYTENLEAILPAVNGIMEKQMFSKLAAVPSLAGHAQAATLFDDARDGSLLDWLKDNGHVLLDADGNISVPTLTEASA